MGFTYEEKRSSSPYVDIVWHTEDQTDGVYIASADASWDMIFIQPREGKRRVLLSGPCWKTTLVPYSAGNKNFGMRFNPGVIFIDLPVTDMVNVTQPLPMPTEDTFLLQGIVNSTRGITRTAFLTYSNIPFRSYLKLMVLPRVKV